MVTIIQNRKEDGKMKLNRKVFMAVLVFLLAATPVMAADVFVRIGTSSVGGGFYLIGNTIAQLGTQELKEINFTAVTGGSIKNC